MVKTNSRRDRFLSYRDGLGIGLVQGWRPLSPTEDTLRFPRPPASLASCCGDSRLHGRPYRAIETHRLTSGLCLQPVSFGVDLAKPRTFVAGCGGG